MDDPCGDCPLSLGPGSYVFVHANYNADDVRTFYEIPETVVERVRAAAPEVTFVEALASLIALDEVDVDG